MKNNDTFELSFLIKKWKTILTFGLVFALIFYLYTLIFSKPTYSCSRAYAIDNSISYSNDDYNKQASMNDITVSRTLVETYQTVISLPGVMEELVDYIKAEHDQEIPYTSLSSCIKVTTKGSTEIMNISVLTGDRAKSRIISDSVDTFLIPYISDSIGFAEIKSLGRLTELVNNKSPIISTFYGFLFGVILAVITVFISYLINNKVSDEEDFAKSFNVPILGNIPDPQYVTKGGYKYGK